MRIYKLSKISKEARKDKGDLLVVEGKVKHMNVKILIDSGATGLFIHPKLVRLADLSTVEKSVPDKVKLADGHTISSTHVTRVQFKVNHSEYKDQDTFHVVDLGDFDMVLGKPWLRRLNPVIDWVHNTLKFTFGGRNILIASRNSPQQCLANSLILNIAQFRKAEASKPREQPLLLCTIKQLEDGEIDFKIDSPSHSKVDLPVDWKEQMSQIASKYKDVLPEGDVQPTYPPARAIEHEVPIIPGSTIPNRPTYRMSPSELDELKKEISSLLERGLIRPSTSPYGAPVILVPKKDGGKRLVIDYRLVNAITIKNRYPLPRIDDLMDQLHGAKIFSKIDMASGFHQIRMAEADCHKSAFRTRFGHYEFTVLPMGMTSAPATFQRLMNDIFMPYLDKFVIIYLDDLCIYSKTPEEHIKHLEIVLGLLREHKLLAKPSKCLFGVTSMDFLGHIISSDGIATDPKKIKAVQDWPIPKNNKDILSFMGLANFYRRFVKDFSKIAAPLTSLTGKDVPFQWGPKAQESFDALKLALTTAPVLAVPDFTRPFLVRCDASKFAIGQVLCQGEGKEERVIAYESRKLSPAELKYEIHDKELLSVVHALRKWRHYLYGARQRIETDNWATKFIQTKPILNKRQASWLDLLQEFDLDIVHRPGDTNVVADALSRRPDYVLNAIQWLTPDNLFEEVRSHSRKDPEYRKLLKLVQEKPQSRPDFSLKNDLLYKGDRLYVPEGRLRTTLLTEAHDTPISGHLGKHKTYERLARSFYWPRLPHMVGEYCRTCPTCQSIKGDTQKPIGLLQPLSIPRRKWDSVSLDLIVHLPKTRNGHTAIVVFVDRASKMIICEPTVNEVTAEQLAQLYYKAVFRFHGVPSELVSDRDPKFTSDFWQAFHKRLGTRFNMSTANHAQTDGQTERANRTLEDMLRAYVSPHHDDWDEHLVAVEFAYNDSMNPSIGYSPFYLNYGSNPNTPLSLICKTEQEGSEEVQAFAARMRKDFSLARNAIRMAQATQAKYHNAHYRDCTFSVGDKVWLSAAHLRRPHAENATKKLEPKFHGPYKIIEVVSPVAYRLALPKSWRIHPVINISHLKANKDGSKDFPDRPEYQPPPPPQNILGEDYYRIEAFRKHRHVRKQLQFWVKWSGYKDDENLWKSASDLQKEMTPESYKILLENYIQRTKAKLAIKLVLFSISS